MFVLCGDRCGDVDCGFGVDLGEIEDSWSSLPGSSSMMISDTSISGVDAVESIFQERAWWNFSRRLLRRLIRKRL